MNRECDALAIHLIGRRCPPGVAKRYEAALQELGLDLSPLERRLWHACVRSRLLLSCLDSGTSLFHRGGAIRRRLLVMFALLEACPDAADRFLFTPVTPFGLVQMLGHAAVAALAIVMGTPLGLLCRVAARRARN